VKPSVEMTGAETFSDLLAGDCTPILFLGKTDMTFKAKSGYRNTQGI
jgi:hypothetical protein